MLQRCSLFLCSDVVCGDPIALILNPKELLDRGNKKKNNGNYMKKNIYIRNVKRIKCSPPLLLPYDKGKSASDVVARADRNACGPAKYQTSDVDSVSDAVFFFAAN